MQKVVEWLGPIGWTRTKNTLNDQTKIHKN